MRPNTPAPQTITLPPASVFIVDDDEAVRDSLKWLLEANAYRVQCFDSAERFLDAFDASRVGVLILDVRMPGMSGLDLQAKLHELSVDIPIIIDALEDGLENLCDDKECEHCALRGVVISTFIDALFKKAAKTELEF